MTSTLASPPTAHETPSAAPSGQPARGGGRKRTAAHYIAIVIGCLVLLPALGMIAGGGGMLIGQAVAADDDGYFRFTLDRIESDGVAIATTDLWLDDVEGDASPWLLDWLDVDLRLRVAGASTTDEVFVGIARSADVQDYLSGAMYSEVVEVDGPATRYQEITGAQSVEAPADQDFWVASAVGTDEQELTWEARGGRWSVVVMKSDGSAGVSADVEVGAKSGAVTPIGITLLAVGGFLAIVGTTLIVIGARGRRVDHDSNVVPVSSVPETHAPASQTPASQTPGSPLPPPTPSGDVPTAGER